MQASTLKGIRVVGALAAAFAILVVAVRLSPIGAFIHSTNEWSAIMSLQQPLDAQLQIYHAQHGGYPDSLRALTIDYSKTDQATAAHLDKFHYRVTESGYELSPIATPLKQPPESPF